MGTDRYMEMAEACGCGSGKRILPFRFFGLKKMGNTLSVTITGSAFSPSLFIVARGYKSPSYGRAKNSLNRFANGFVKGFTVKWLAKQSRKRTIAPFLSARLRRVRTSLLATMRGVPRITRIAAFSYLYLLAFCLRYTRIYCGIFLPFFFF